VAGELPGALEDQPLLGFLERGVDVQTGVQRAAGGGGGGDQCHVSLPDS
jgi:hypothetical protein